MKEALERDNGKWGEQIKRIASIRRDFFGQPGAGTHDF